MLLSFVSLMLVIASYTMVKSVRDALFLSKFGVTQLSFIAIGLAVLIGFIISIYLRGTADLARNRLIWGTNSTIAASLVLIWIGLSSESLAPVLPWVLYIWSSIFGVFIVMQFWLIANELFDPREAKRLFGFIGGGAILGGVIGGFTSRSLAGVIGTANLLLLSGGLLVVEAVLISWLWPLRRKEAVVPRRAQPQKKVDKRGGIYAMRINSIVRIMAVALLLSTIATTLLDWQFKGIVKDAFAGRTDEMAAFFGALYGYLSLGSFMIQTLFTARILRRFGVGVGLLFLPVSVMIGSGIILAHVVIPWISRLAAASTAKVAEGGLRFAIDKASMELMWLPVPPDVKVQGKSFVDTVVDRLGTGITGFIWLGFAAFGLSDPDRIHLISWAVGGIVLLWVFVLLKARRAYLHALRDILAQRKLDLGHITTSLDSAEIQRTITALLSSDDPQEVHFGLYLLGDMPGRLPDLAPAMAHDDAFVRERTLELLTRRGSVDYRVHAVDCLLHTSNRVRLAAITYLRRTAPMGNDPLYEEIARKVDMDPLLVEVIKIGIPAHAVMAAGMIQEDLRLGDKGRVIAILELLGAAPPEMAAALLSPYIAHEDHEVVNAAIGAVGRSGAEGLTAQLCGLLHERRTRRACMEVLRDLGDKALPHLLTMVRGAETPELARIGAIQLLGTVRRADVAPLLLDTAAADDSSLAHHALRALNRLRNGDNLQLDEPQAGLVRGRVDQEILGLYRELAFLGRGSWTELRQAEPPEALLEVVLRQSADHRVERIFRLLALLFDPQDLYMAYLGVRSPLKVLRANSLEFLDNLLPKDLSARLFPLLEAAGLRRFTDAARQAGFEGQGKRSDMLKTLILGNDEVMRLIAIWIVGAEGIHELKAELESRSSAASALTRSEIQRALGRIERDESKEHTMGLTTIEKALKLQKADVLSRTSIEDMTYIAQIATEEEISAGTSIYHEGDAPDALYVLVSGLIRLHQEDSEIAVLEPGEAFGGWALVDESPRVAAATAQEDSVLLRVGRVEFTDLLADRVGITQAVFSGMVEKLRGLADVGQSKG